MQAKPAECRFWPKVDKTAKNGCWLWKASKFKNGYGQFHQFTYPGATTMLAHRFSYQLMRGEIPADKELDHLCRNRSCVNPNHLEIVSHRENDLRGMGVSAINAKKVYCPNGHLLAGDNLMNYPLKLGARLCKICTKKRMHDYNKIRYESRNKGSC